MKWTFAMNIDWHGSQSICQMSMDWHLQWAQSCLDLLDDSTLGS